MKFRMLINFAGFLPPLHPWANRVFFIFHISSTSYLNLKSDVSVAALQKLGVDFECKVALCKGAPKKPFFRKILPRIFDPGDFATFSEIARYVVIKDSSCYVYLEATDLSPLYVSFVKKKCKSRSC